ncbi:hypothetical protein BU26DRAFT_534945 [Trematosphaeria pertusa]|uniref:Uncharacterized protein n=1 Tax=Trematosphaeria pertusa TaxID=390896 RepID=A0A6A6HV90_9PLEO|nr:uncharacterized protein BU26DRAFT_534945 [Trematosphaeria pertusa]KAF2241931.1 hypothetical protein BU26DRAFT_534945 [Trematosphaeria pertusa]
MHSPSYADVCVARAMLNALKLPTELVLEILDRARYWPALKFTSIRLGRAVAGISASVSASLSLEAGILSPDTLRHICSSTETPKVKEIEFWIESRDQGWTSEHTGGTFNTSSWLEVSIFRPGSVMRDLPPAHLMFKRQSSPLELQRMLQDYGWTLVTRPESVEQGPQAGEGHLAWYLQGNRVAWVPRYDYRVVWAFDHFEGNEGAGRGEGFLQELKEGDRLLIWARAKYPGWECIVGSVKMTVHYGF